MVSPLELSALAGAGGVLGYVLNGVSAQDQVGRAVGRAGDVNGDGLEDAIVGAPFANPVAADTGAAYVVFGQTGGPAVIELSAVAAGSGGFIIRGAAPGDTLGVAVSGAGDVNGDGLADLIVGGSTVDFNNIETGAAYVVFGKTSTAGVDLSAVAAGSGGFVLRGAAGGDGAGVTTAAAGDVDGDGLADLIVGAPGVDGIGVGNGSGAAYVVFGKTTTTAVNLSAVAGGTGGFVLRGAVAGDDLGRSISGAGDVNGDGLADLVVGAPGADPNGTQSGNAYVVFGKSTTAAVDMSAVAAGVGGFVMRGAGVQDFAGDFVGGAGDVNGDGLADVVIGAYRANPNGGDSGAAYLVFGKTSTAAVELSGVAGGTGGFIMRGGNAGDFAGEVVAGAGDVDGDGLADILVGAYAADPNGERSGAAYLVYGKTSTGAVELAALGSGGFAMHGEFAGDYSGTAGSSAGDFNGDGLADLLLGGFGASPNGNQSGVAYVVLGDLPGATTQAGDAGPNTLTGTAGADRFVGGRGADGLIGNGGPDVLYGGQGDDTLAIRDLLFAALDGGTGHDTLRLDGPGLALDLTDRVRAGRLAGIEAIDLSGAGDHTLTLDALAVRNLSPTSNTLIVKGAAGDRVGIGRGWTPSGTELIDGQSFEVFRQGQATLKVTAGLVPFHLTTLTPTATGFVAQFSRTLDATVFNLYDQGNALGAADLSIVGATTGPVRGSAVIHPDRRGFTFIRTGGPLAADTYAVSLATSAIGIRDVGGSLLDGNYDGTAGDPFVQSIVVTAPAANAVTVSLPDFARGPGQPVNLPANGNAGLPLTISTGQGITRVSLKFRFDTALLSVSGFSANPGLSGATVLFSVDSNGVGSVSVSKTTPFSATPGAVLLGGLIAAVPSSAPYAAAHVLDLFDVQVTADGGVQVDVPAVDDDALHLAAFFGDANGSRTYNAPDAALLARVISQVNTGFSAYPAIDPVVVADITQNGSLQANDSTGLLRVISQVGFPTVPPLPSIASKPPRADVVQGLVYLEEAVRLSRARRAG